MDMGFVVNVAGVVTQSAKSHNQTVSSYTVQVSSNGNDFEAVDGGRVFCANKGDWNDPDHKVENKFVSLVQARYVKIVVKTWVNWPSLRAAILLPEAAPIPVEVFLPDYSQSSASSCSKCTKMVNKGGDATLDGPRYWRASSEEAGEWYQMDLGSVKEVAGIVTQGHGPVGDCYMVTSYKVQASLNDHDFEYVDGGNLFRGTQPADGGDSKVESFFSTVVQARFVKIMPQSWHRHQNMRAAVLLPEAR